MSELIIPEQRRQVATPAIQQDTSIMAVISRAAADPSCDIDKMERLLQMHERMQAKEAEQAFNAAMAQMQCEIPTVGEGGLNTHTGNSYATLDDINYTLKPIMQRHGFAITFKVDHVGAGVKVTGILMHAAGHREDTTMFLPMDIGKGRNDVQAVGSSVTYARRYVMCALLNITTGETRDDDGQSADGSETDDMRAQVVADIIERVKQAKTPDELKEVWQAALRVLQASGDTNGYNTVKTAVTAHKAILEKSV